MNKKSLFHKSILTNNFTIDHRPNFLKSLIIKKINNSSKFEQKLKCSIKNSGNDFNNHKGIKSNVIVNENISEKQNEKDTSYFDSGVTSRISYYEDVLKDSHHFTNSGIKNIHYLDHSSNLVIFSPNKNEENFNYVPKKNINLILSGEDYNETDRNYKDVYNFLKISKDFLLGDKYVV